ncbi:helix-turn-helix domain-containing protein [Halomicrobium sp. LC1Hm]|uniref:ArsR/SmtB family transcription factor n=1 Tax=Halomicrobium sp. LC1Hm TaxID=2610902 RepID=UPI001298587F|nr:helix-turn-helix domain-containing protein [Halomicrobium sp. LC1Hm]QGA84267.1 ArsR family transcriptional regulator [Halomicrobium sp. LC1Hm]
MSLLPSSRSETESSQDGSLQLLDVDDEEADAVFDALSSQTTRTVLAEIHRTPGTPAELAERADTTIQNVMYHIEKLEAVELVRVTETRYSARGKEMAVYGPCENPAVVFLGTDDRKQGLIAKLKRFLGGFLVFGLLYALFETATELVRGIEQSAVSGASNPKTILVPATGAVTTLIVTYVSADGQRTVSFDPRRLSDLNTMQRRTLLASCILLVGVCTTPVALAYSPAVSDDYFHHAPSASISATPADAGVPDLPNQTVNLVVTGDNDALEAPLTERLSAALRDRGATVRHRDEVGDVSGSLLVVRFETTTFDAGGLTRDANVTTQFAYVESGDGAAAERIVASKQRSFRGGADFPSNTTGQAAGGAFVFERAGGTGSPLTTIKRTNSSAEAFTDETAALVGDRTVSYAFGQDIWN